MTPQHNHKLSVVIVGFIITLLFLWNDYIQKTLHIRPATVTTPILIKTSEMPFSPDNHLLEDTKKVIIESGALDPEKARKAIMGILNRDPITSKKAFVSTKEALGQDNPFYADTELD
jgi:hypothetical protein